MTNEQDNREKLVEDIMRTSEVTYDTHNEIARTIKARYLDVIEWLDRQAAITEHELVRSARSDCDVCGNDYRRQRDELQEQISDYKASIKTVEANSRLWHEQAVSLREENKTLARRVQGLLLELLIISDKLGDTDADNKTACGDAGDAE